MATTNWELSESRNNSLGTYISGQFNIQILNRVSHAASWGNTILEV
jgi:hypothetical protein